MPTFNDDQQQQTPATPETPPSQTSEVKDWEAEAKKLQRQLDSVRGNLDQEKKRTGELDTQLKRLTGDYEQERSSLTNEKTTLSQQFETEKQTKAALEAELNKYKRQLSIMGLANQKYPGLIPLLTGTEEEPPVLVIPDNVTTPEQLDAYLSRAQQRLGTVVQSQAAAQVQGASPAPPASGQHAAMTLDEVQDKKVDAARRKDWKAHAEFSRMEDELLRNMFTKK